MSRPLAEYFEKVISTDIQDFSGVFPEQDGVQDFLLSWDGEQHECDWVISNPPFNIAQEFIERALSVAKVGVAMLVRLQFLEGGERCETLFKVRPPSMVIQFSERLAMHKGKIEKKQSTATAYAWFVWDCETHDAQNEALGPRLWWFFKGTRAAHERDDDYPDWAARKPLADAPLFETLDGGEYREP